MKKIILSMFFLLAGLSVWAQQKSVEVAQAGTLGTLLSAGERAGLTSLKVKGPLNGDDVLVLRELGKSHLSDLDLSEATIVKGGACYFPVGSDQDAYTQDDRFSTRFFYGCTALRSVVIPNTLMSVSNDAFSSCPNLSEIRVADNDYFTSVDGILYNSSMERLVRCPQAKALTSFDVPAGVLELYPSAFRDVKTLTSVSLPPSLMSVSDFAFAGCPLKIIRCGMRRASIGLAFDTGTFASARVVVPQGSASDFKSVEGWNKFSTIVEE